MSFAIAFDFPSAGVEQQFAQAFAANIPALSPSLEHAARFESEEAAQRFLDGSYGPGVARWGAVVEVDRT